MTDAKTAASKPMWTRCPGCKDRIFNDKLDIGIHKGHCPADLMRRMQKIENTLKQLDARVDGLDTQVSAEPALTPDDIAPWEDDDVSEYPTDDDGDVVTTESDVESIPVGQYYADETDDEDEPDYSTVSRSVV